LNYYGPRPNAELLRQYGYVTLDHARYDVVELPWSLVESNLKQLLNLSDRSWKAVMKHVDEEDLEDGFVIERECPDVSSEGTFVGPAVLREMPSDLTNQIKAVLKATRKVDEKLVPEKRKRDDLVHCLLSRCLDELFRQYATTIDDDKRRLAAGGLSARCYMATVVRLGEKLVLQEAVGLLGESKSKDGDRAGPTKKARK